MERVMAMYRVTSSTLAVALLVIGNLIPLLGVLAWDWDLIAILTLYWVENGIVGVINVLKILRAEGTGVGSMQLRINARPVSSLTRGPVAAFFTIHYGAFWVGHGIFVLVALPLMIGPLPGGPLTPDGDFLGSPFGSPDWGLVAYGALGLAISHGSSYWFNYLGRGEYHNLSPAQLMLAPYGRLVILHVTIVMGGIASGLIGTPVGALLVLVALKTVLDLFFHLREHRRAAAPEVLPTPA